jgi:hypothetical protein
VSTSITTRPAPADADPEGSCIITKGGVQCAGETAAIVTAGCVHEHIKTRRVCAEHVAEMQARIVYCGGCFHGSEPHRCLVVIGRIEAS